MVSGELVRDSAMYIQVSILPQAPLPSRPPHNTERSSLCYPWLVIHFKHISAYLSNPNSLTIPSLNLPLGNHKFVL